MSLSYRFVSFCAREAEDADCFALFCLLCLLIASVALWDRVFFMLENRVTENSCFNNHNDAVRASKVLSFLGLNHGASMNDVQCSSSYLSEKREREEAHGNGYSYQSLLGWLRSNSCSECITNLQKKYKANEQIGHKRRLEWRTKVL